MPTDAAVMRDSCFQVPNAAAQPVGRDAAAPAV